MESDSQNNSSLTLLAPLAPVVCTSSSAVASTNAGVVVSNSVLGADYGNLKSELTIESEAKPPAATGLNFYQLPVVPLDAAVNAVSAGGNILQMSSSIVGVPVQQRHSFMTAVGSDVVSCSDAVADQRSSSISQQLSPHHQNLPHHQVPSYNASVGGRMSPPCYPGSSTYATLTPFQPLPPISTVSDKFSGGGGNGMGFVYMQNHASPSDLGQYGDGSDVYAPYKYTEKDVVNAEMSNADQTMNCTSFESSQNGIAMVMNGSGYMMQQQQPAARNFQSPYSIYGHATQNNQPLTAKSEMNGAVTRAAVDSLSSYENIATIYTSNLMSASSVQPKNTAIATSISPNVGSVQVSSNSAVAVAALMSHRPSPGADMRCQMRVGSPDQPSSSTDMRGCDDDASSMPADGSGAEEINTRDVALKVSNELKKYSIPQAVFAQRVLGRSQGTLSDLLRNPKPWSKLKSGRETFRRMWKWLQEPEYQRMASLRTGPDVVGGYNIPDSVSPPAVKQPIVCKRTREGTPVTSTQVQVQVQAPVTITSQHRPPDSQSAIATALGGSGGGGGPASTGCPPKKPRMVFTEIQRRTLVAIFKEIKRPSKEIQATIAEQLGLKQSTVVNFFMNARRRSVDKYLDETPASSGVSSGTDRDAVSSTAGSSDDSLRQ